MNKRKDLIMSKPTELGMLYLTLDGGFKMYFSKDLIWWGVKMSYSNEIEETDIDTKTCDMDYCEELTEKNERYCLKCQKLIDDINLE